MGNIKEKLKSIKGWKLIFAAILAVVAMLIAFGGTFFDKKSDEQAEAEQAYIERMQNKIVSVVQSMDGCGKAEVAISCSAECGKQYAYNTAADGSVSVSLVNGQPVVVRELLPEIYGVVVVCEGASDPVVRMKITQVVVTLLDVDISCVQVFAYKA